MYNGLHCQQLRFPKADFKYGNRQLNLILLAFCHYVNIFLANRQILLRFFRFFRFFVRFYWIFCIYQISLFSV